MPKDTPPNGGAPVDVFGRVAQMQARLRRWAVADPGRRFDDLFNLVHDPATLIVAVARVAGNRGANTAGVDGVTVAALEQRLGVPGFLGDLRSSVKDGAFWPLPVRERIISKPGGSGKLRRLGIPVVADRVAQTVVANRLSVQVEPVFHPDSYGYRPGRSALDAVAVTRQRCWNKNWVVDLDIAAFFDSVDHRLLLKAVAAHTEDPWVLLDAFDAWMSRSNPACRLPGTSMTSSCTYRRLSTRGTTSTRPSARRSSRR